MRRRSRSLVVAVAALALAAAACSGDDTSEAAFSFESDDLCGRVSEDEVADMVAAEFDWDGAAAEVEAGPSDCEWELTGPDRGTVLAEDATGWRDFDDNPIDLNRNYQAEGATEYDGDQVEIGEFVIDHPALSEDVVVLNGGFGQFAFGVPPNPEWLALTVLVPGVEDWDDDYENRFFAVADRFLNELGWTQ